ncbi:LTA synthase family protein [Neisseria animalis]|nr:LTA synthase family protein [Neisseria animalis]
MKRNKAAGRLGYAVFFMPNEHIGERIIMKWVWFKKLLPEWLLFFTAGIMVCAAGRGYLFGRYAGADLQTAYSADVAAMWLKGFLFDIKTVSLMSAILVLAALLGLANQKLMAAVYRIHYRCAALLLTLLAALTSGNIFYYAVYDRPFDVFVFGLLEDDTQAVLQTIWTDYPVIWIIFAVLAVGWLFQQIFRRLHIRMAAKETRCSDTWWQRILWVLMIVLALTAGIRTSFGKFPLRQSDAQVSSLAILNKLVPNAVTALSWAVGEYRSSSFHEVGDEEGRKLFSVMTGRQVAGADWTELAAKTQQNKLPARPNVALAVMESMGTHLFRFDTLQRDLLGRLRPHFQQDWLFTRFVSEGDGTADTMHRLFIRSPLNNISQSTAKNKKYPTNLFAPFKASGYQTVYITAGNGGWRDFNNFTKHLGVDEFIDETALRRRYPEAVNDTWGVPDEYMFRYAAERLQRAEREGQPVFILMLSITHHPPYRLPPTGERIGMALDAEEQSRLQQLGKPAEIEEAFNTFRYANDSLGAFIDEVKQSGKTIVAATGDHNMRGIGYASAEEQALGHAVPFYLYVPEQLRGEAVYRPERVGSHKDVMPTLYALSIPEQAYLKTGCNLTAPDNHGDTWCGYGYNKHIVITESGATDIEQGTFRKWRDKEKLLLATAVDDIPTEEQEQVKRGRTYGAFLDWLLNRMATMQ